MTKVRELVERWLEEEVEIENGDVTISQNGSVNLIEWLKGRKGHKDGVRSYKFDSAMMQKGFKQKHDSEFVTSSYDAFGDFLNWLNRQSDGGYVARNHSALR